MKSLSQISNHYLKQCLGKGIQLEFGSSLVIRNPKTQYKIKINGKVVDTDFLGLKSASGQGLGNTYDVGSGA